MDLNRKDGIHSTLDLSGKLSVIEGTGGAGRTTQINLLNPWLEELGHAVLDTGMTRSHLTGEGIRRALALPNPVFPHIQSVDGMR